MAVFLLYNNVHTDIILYLFKFRTYEHRLIDRIINDIVNYSDQTNRFFSGVLFSNLMFRSMWERFWQPYDNNTVQLNINSDTRTRGRAKKSVVRRCRYDVRKYSFSIRITNIWNSLPDEIISAPTVNTFKNRLDRFWAEQEVFYNYKANITGNKGVSLYHYNMIIYVNDHDVGIEALPTPTITLLLLLLLECRHCVSWALGRMPSCVRSCAVCCDRWFSGLC